MSWRGARSGCLGGAVGSALQPFPMLPRLACHTCLPYAYHTICLPYACLPYVPTICACWAYLRAHLRLRHLDAPHSRRAARLAQLRLGRQYLFVHHGNCEHSIVFTRCWLASPLHDALAARLYPRLVFKRAQPLKTCSVCVRAAAAWEVHGDREADALPCYLCQQCHFQVRRHRRHVPRAARRARCIRAPSAPCICT